VRWVVEGSELELDRKVLEVVKEPLLHLVRNAIDHGIEAAEARVRAGKPPGGSVCVRFTALERNCVEVEVSDDGRGIEPEKVRGAAVRARLLSQDEARALSEDVVLQLVYRSGLSTSPIVTQISGHGLGLAIVKEAVERVGGHVQLQSRAGTGTTVRLTLPAAVATFRGLLVSAGGQSFLLPLENVERAVRVAECDLESIEGRPSMRWNGSALLAAPLAAVLDLAELTGGERSNDVRPGVVLRHGDERAVLLVDDITGHREVLVKALGAPLMRVRNVAAAGLVGTGEVVLILRPADLLATIRAGVRRPAPSPVAKPPAAPPVVLVVDDSITTRTMEKNLLESAGYRVRVAVDGLEAMTLLKTEPVDLVLSDIDMPRMDGFELTARIRTDRQLADLPVVLVTALESREDKERGIEVGANAYVVKSSFDQSNLLGILQRLV
jgi:two-component system chemotaxis sensor kinase CheA